MAISAKQREWIEQDRLARLEKAKAFIAKPLVWPKWPILPMVKIDGGNWREEDGCAVLFADGKLILYFANLFTINDRAKQIQDETGKRPTWGALLDDCKTREFASVDELLREYRVD